MKKYLYHKENEPVLLDPRLFIFFQCQPKLMHGIMLLRFQPKDKTVIQLRSMKESNQS
jgi:hypothetical protein